MDTAGRDAARLVDALCSTGQLTRRSFLGGIGLAAGGLVLAACGGGNGTAASTPSQVELLAILDLTGPLAPIGMQMVAGAALAVAAINKAGGLLGSTLTLALQDSGSDPRRAQHVVAAAESAGKHRAVLLDPLAPVPQNARLTYLRAGVDLGVPFSSREFRAMPSLATQATLLGRYAKDQKASRLHVVVPNLPWLDANQVAASVAATSGLQLAATSIVSLEQASFVQTLDEVQRSAADCMLCLTPGAPQVSLYQQLAASPLHGRVLPLSPVFGAGGEQQQAGASGGAVVVASPFFAGMAGADPTWLSEVSSRLKGGGSIGDAAASAWLAWTAWSALVQHTGSWDATTKSGSTAHIAAPEGAATADTSLHRVRRTVALAVGDGKGVLAVQSGYTADDDVPASAAPGARS